MGTIIIPLAVTALVIGLAATAAFVVFQGSAARPPVGEQSWARGFALLVAMAIVFVALVALALALIIGDPFD